VIDPKLFTVDNLIATFTNTSVDNVQSRWMDNVAIIAKWLPQFPTTDQEPRCVVRYRDLYLRFSKGPRQVYFWDIYPDDMLTPELALWALTHAPIPFICIRPRDDQREPDPSPDRDVP
jgi:hypothetical protein